MQIEKVQKTTKSVFKITLRFSLYFVAFILLYLSIGFLLSRISTDKEVSADQSVEIFVLSNGVHTDVVMPYRTSQKDWSLQFSSEHTKGKRKASEFNWVATGWGDKGFYLETPTWDDLTFKTAFKAAFGLSSAAVHATLYEKMEESEVAKSIRISKKQYAQLIKYVESSLQKDEKQSCCFIPTNAVYGKNDAFYESKGTYSLFHTCNTWANNALKASRQRACWWTWNSSSILRLHEK